MYDKGKILIGLVAFLVVATFPFWFTNLFGSPSTRPVLELPKGEKKCVEDTEYMRHWHMNMLDQWRNEVVREGKRMYVSSDGRKFEMSLNNNCLKCHESREKFCDRCHNYVGVTPYCWDCHVTPTGE